MTFITIVKILFIILFGGIAIYCLFMIIGTLIPINRKYKPEDSGIDIYLSTNGMHTDFILPTITSVYDWTKVINQQYFQLSPESLSFLGVGWGDKAIYLDIPTWGDLTLKMGLNSLLLPTPTILHVTAYDALPSEKLKIEKITVSSSQYAQLCDFILSYFARDEKEDVRLIEGAGYTENDVFYHANGVYHAFQTCNIWINKGLKTIGVRTTLWSPLDKGLFYQLKKIRKGEQNG